MLFPFFLDRRGLSQEIYRLYQITVSRWKRRTAWKWWGMRFSFLGKGKPFWSQVQKTNVLPHIASIQANFYCGVTFFPVLETNYFLIYHRTSVKRMQLVLRKDKQRLEIWQLKVLVHEFWKTDWNMNCNKYLHWWLHYDKNQLQYSLILTFCLQTPSVDDRVDLHFVAIVHRDGCLYELGEWLTKWVFIVLDNASFIELAF